jgi:hypothetical protein
MSAHNCCFYTKYIVANIYDIGYMQWFRLAYRPLA